MENIPVPPGCLLFFDEEDNMNYAADSVGNFILHPVSSLLSIVGK